MNNNKILLSLFLLIALLITAGVIYIEFRITAGVIYIEFRITAGVIYIEFRIIGEMSNFEEPSYSIPQFNIELKGTKATLAHIGNFILYMDSPVLHIVF